MTIQPLKIDVHTESLIRMAVEEDVGTGDRTVQLAIPADQQGVAIIVARKAGIISGTTLFQAILRHYDGNVRVESPLADGSRVTPGQPITTLRGPVPGLLSAERVLLNFLGHLSGIATLTRQYVDAIDAALPAGVQRPSLCDTRKTTPGFRVLDKYAVRCGGGVNHRIGLYDGVMLKDNHLAALRERHGKNLSLAQLTARIRTTLAPEIPLWLEVDSFDQLLAALPPPQSTGADIILLDNFAPADLRKAVELRNSRRSPVLLEASGGITLANLADVARTGVDRISIGAITHSAPVLDVSVDWGGQA